MTQNEAVLAELMKRHGEWVPMPQLAAASGAYADARDAQVEWLRKNTKPNFK